MAYLGNWLLYAIFLWQSGSYCIENLREIIGEWINKAEHEDKESQESIIRSLVFWRFMVHNLSVFSYKLWDILDN
jgi:hypothetical protein